MTTQTLQPETGPPLTRSKHNDFLGVGGGSVAYRLNLPFNYTTPKTSGEMNLVDGYLLISQDLLERWYNQYLSGGKPGCAPLTLYTPAGPTVKPVLLLACPVFPKADPKTLEQALTASTTGGPEAFTAAIIKASTGEDVLTPEAPGDCTGLIARLPDGAGYTLKSWLQRHDLHGTGAAVCLDDKTVEKLGLSKHCYGRELARKIVDQAYSPRAILGYGAGCTAGLLACNAKLGPLGGLLAIGEVLSVCWLPQAISHHFKGSVERALAENGKLGIGEAMMVPWAPSLAGGLRATGAYGAMGGAAVGLHAGLMAARSPFLGGATVKRAAENLLKPAPGKGVRSAVRRAGGFVLGSRKYDEMVVRKASRVILGYTPRTEKELTEVAKLFSTLEPRDYGVASYLAKTAGRDEVFKVLEEAGGPEAARRKLYEKYVEKLYERMKQRLRVPVEKTVVEKTREIENAGKELASTEKELTNKVEELKTGIAEETEKIESLIQKMPEADRSRIAQAEKELEALRKQESKLSSRLEEITKSIVNLREQAKNVINTEKLKPIIDEIYQKEEKHLEEQLEAAKKAGNEKEIIKYTEYLENWKKFGREIVTDNISDLKGYEKYIEALKEDGTISEEEERRYLGTIEELGGERAKEIKEELSRLEEERKGLEEQLSSIRNRINSIEKEVSKSERKKLLNEVEKLKRRNEEIDGEITELQKRLEGKIKDFEEKMKGIEEELKKIKEIEEGRTGELEKVKKGLGVEEEKGKVSVSSDTIEDLMESDNPEREISRKLEGADLGDAREAVEAVVKESEEVAEGSRRGLRETLTGSIKDILKSAPCTIVGMAAGVASAYTAVGTPHYKKITLTYNDEGILLDNIPVLEAGKQ